MTPPTAAARVFRCPSCKATLDDGEFEVVMFRPSPRTARLMAQDEAVPNFEDENELIHWVMSASDDEVGPACMNVPVPPTIADDEQFREIYCQGYRHALAAVRRWDRRA